MAFDLDTYNENKRNYLEKASRETKATKFSEYLGVNTTKIVITDEINNLFNYIYTNLKDSQKPPKFFYDDIILLYANCKRTFMEKVLLSFNRYMKVNFKNRKSEFDIFCEEHKDELLLERKWLKLPKEEKVIYTQKAKEVNYWYRFTTSRKDSTLLFHCYLTKHPEKCFLFLEILYTHLFHY